MLILAAGDTDSAANFTTAIDVRATNNRIIPYRYISFNYGIAMNQESSKTYDTTKRAFFHRRKIIGSSEEYTRQTWGTCQKLGKEGKDYLRGGVDYFFKPT